jgi:hypothetical protein
VSAGPGMLSPTPLQDIPVVDVRTGGTVQHAREGCARARALRDACLTWFPGATEPLTPLLDWFARRWLERSQSPYLGEIQAIAATLGFPGVWLLNASYQWGCTSLAREEDGVPWLARTLDWPFPGLGRHVEIAHMRGAAGDFYNLTWPGYVGVLTAMAPGRFAAAMNQAPLWRRTRRPWLRPYDLAANVLHTWLFVRHIPPDQLLRTAFETCGSFDEARTMLERVPIARPAIFTLAGCKPGEHCVIERTETRHATHLDATCAANDWVRPAEGWEGRISSEVVLTCTIAEAAENSRTRRESLLGWRGAFGRESFAWVAPPVLNRYTRLAAELSPASGTLRVVGYELAPGGELAAPATLPCELGPQLVVN